MLLTYYLLVALVLAAWFGLYWLWNRRVQDDATAGAAYQFEHLSKAEPQLLEGLDQHRFREIFARVEVPQQPFYTFIAVAIFLTGAPLALALSAIGIRWMEVTGIIPQPAEQARQLQLSAEGIKIVGTADLEALELILQGWGGFFSFFALLVFWVAVFYAVMRRYHARRPGSLREEVLRSR